MNYEVFHTVSFYNKHHSLLWNFQVAISNHFWWFFFWTQYFPCTYSPLSIMQTLQKSRPLPLALLLLLLLLVLCTVNFGCLSLLGSQTPLLSWEIVESLPLGYVFQTVLWDSYVAHLISFPHAGDYIEAGCYCFIYFVWIFVVLDGKVNLVPFAPSWLKIKLAFIYSHLTPVPFYLYWSYHLKVFSFILSYFLNIFVYKFEYNEFCQFLVYNKMFSPIIFECLFF